MRRYRTASEPTSPLPPINETNGTARATAAPGAGSPGRYPGSRDAPARLYDPHVRAGLAWAAASAAWAALAAGCGSSDDPPPSACSAGARTVLGALQRAPGA